MKITIVHNESRNNRADFFDGENVRYGGVGVSGSDQTFILVAESFARAGHNTIVCSPANKNSIYRGVIYQDNWSGIYDSDVLIIPPWFKNFNDLKRFTQLKCIFINMQSATFMDMNQICYFFAQYPSCRICFVYPSEWAKQSSLISISNISFVNRTVDHIVIGNPLMDDLFSTMEDPTLDRKFSFVFGASWERGGEVAMRAFRRCISENIAPRDATFCIMDYFYASSHKNHASSPNIVALASCDKKTVFETLYKSSYFVYPLVLPNGLVHKDTFGCCVAEALACGTIVLSWPIAALPGLYSDHMVFMPIPENISSKVCTIEPLTIDNWFNSEEAVTIIVNTIKDLEADPERARAIRARGMEFARAQFSAKNVGETWGDLIDAVRYLSL